MVVNSLSFFLFFSIVFLFYYIAVGKRPLIQNTWLVFASYVFYGIAEWKMIPTLAIATALFYWLGIAIEKYNKASEVISSRLTTLGVCMAVGLLLYFKYLNFFIVSFEHFFEALGLHAHLSTFNILMPLGISFFTFKLIAYVLDVHNEEIEAEHDFVAFATYIAFFPTILSGPIDRPGPFLKQLSTPRYFDHETAMDGGRQILWGLLKKMVIADNLSLIIDSAWQIPQEQSSVQLVAVLLLYPFFLYCDFSGYSDMAIGVGKILNIKVTRNFNYPFFGRNISEYWQRWHISLTRWLTDYVFTPLNFSFRSWGKWGTCVAIILNFVICGIWHGAGWNYILFGVFNGLLFVPLILSGSFYRKSKLENNKYGMPRLSDLKAMATTYSLMAIGCVLFAAPSATEAMEFYHSLFCNWSMTTSYSWINIFIITIGILLFLSYEWRNRNREYAFHLPSNTLFCNPIIENAIYVLLVILIISCRAESNTFVYFQF